RTRFVDPFVGNDLIYSLPSWCASVNLQSHAAVVAAYLSAKVEPLLASNAVMLGGGLPNCQFHANPTNYKDILASLPPSSNSWRTVCFAGGTYSGTLIINGYQHLMLRPEYGATPRFAANVFGPTNQIVSVGAVFYSKNIVIYGLSFENTYFV